MDDQAQPTGPTPDELAALAMPSVTITGMSVGTPTHAIPNTKKVMVIAMEVRIPMSQEACESLAAELASTSKIHIPVAGQVTF